MEKVKQIFTSSEPSPHKSMVSKNIAIPSPTDMRNINLNDENSGGNHSTMVETAIIPRGFGNIIANYCNVT